MRSRYLVSLAVVGLITGACADVVRSESSPSESPGAPSVVTVTPDDDGKAIPLHIGQTLVFRGPGDLMRPGYAYNLLQYPKDILELVPTRSALIYVFRVRHAGVGTVRVSLGPRCYSAGPPLPAAAGPPCPVANPKDVKGSLGGMPVQAYTFTIQVYGQGAG